ncbi:restriction endonuclease subunit S [Kluyvera ascorbata]|uniref:restriction endonuclease subunit S n=1 Tax=Kluyvera ascorbata TaxID=51288 RepID=UPI00374CF9A9
MGSKWDKILLGDLIKQGHAILQTGPFGTALKAEEYTSNGVPLISVREIRDGYIKIEDITPRVNKDIINRLPKFVLKKGDIVFARKGGVDRTAYINEKESGWFLGSDGIYLRINDNYNSLFISYIMRSSVTRDWLIKNSEGTTMPSLNQKILSRIPLTIPSLQKQNIIAEFLHSLDRKINISNQINQTLEQMSQTLFKSWFVDFDPVIDNALDAENPIPEALQSRAELRQKVRNSTDFKPLPADIRALFPTDLEETEMGWVPKGWKNGNLSDITKILSGFAFKSKDFGDDGKSVIKIKNITIAKTIDIDDTQKISEIIAKDTNRFLLLDGDILMAMTGATVGKFGVLTTKNNEEYYLNQRVAKFETENKAYLYCVLNQESTDRFITNAAQGSAQPNISAKDILSTPLLIPSVELINTFNDFISHLFYRMIANTKANLNLTALRDTLLPKLISGELSLEDLPDLANQTEPA